MFTPDRCRVGMGQHQFEKGTAGPYAEDINGEGSDL